MGLVAFSNSSMPEIIEDGKTGFLVPEGNIDLAADIAAAAFESVKTKFNIPVWIDNIEKLYLEILEHEAEDD